MQCPECNGNGYTYDNPEDMELQSSGIGHKTWRCWKCNGAGEVEEVEDDDMSECR